MGKINCDGDRIELNVIKPIYKTKYIKKSVGEEIMYVEEPVIQKEIHYRSVFKRDGIVNYGEYITSKHKVSRNRSTLFDTYTSCEYVIGHSYEELKLALSSSKNKIGFK